MTTLAELKKAIKNKNLDDSLFVFCYSDNPFIAFEYTHEIAKIKSVEISVTDDFDYTLSEDQCNMFDFSEIDYLRLFIVDEFTTKLPRNALASMKNVVVICKSVDSKIETMLKELEVLFEIPKLQPWQIEDYMKVSCPGLEEAKAKWLCNIAGYNIDRINNEARKINCFDEKIQDEVFDMIDLDNGYSDLTQTKIYDLSNAINAKNYQDVCRILKEIENMDVEAVGLITILRKNFLLISTIQMDKTATAQSMGIKPTQFNIIKSKNCGRFTDSKLRSILDFLTNFDYKLKSGGYDIDKGKLVDYIICEVLS